MVDFCNKEQVMSFLRSEVNDLLIALMGDDSKRNRQKTKKMNKFLLNLKESLFERIRELYSNEPNDPKLTEAIFLTHYCWIVVSFECRNNLWKYTDTRPISRRSGELWEELLKVAWEYPVNRNVYDLDAPDFSEVKNEIKESFYNKIDELIFDSSIVDEIYSDYNDIWKIIGGSINLDSDQLFETDYERFVIDFKGSYGSNEKGNKNRLLRVAKTYNLLNQSNNIDKPYNCILAVRTVNGRGHNYLRQLEKSGLWEVRTGNEVYKMIHEYTGFDMMSVINKHDLSLMNDFNLETKKHMESQYTSNDKTYAEEYLTWW